jgi:hypothetical protein
VREWLQKAQKRREKSKSDQTKMAERSTFREREKGAKTPWRQTWLVLGDVGMWGDGAHMLSDKGTTPFGTHAMQCDAMRDAAGQGQTTAAGAGAGGGGGGGDYCCMSSCLQHCCCCTRRL